ncbi:hypothetical protein EW145_g4229 [Phellinidium pouzarii]|uniref:Alginate lyase domain-containing protein n=1 Tax=Phellinidium pouzarii TaxID=167371 RepID=A0A4S4L4I5_9AGAM|nr:hypothetical protein EW145_g4229 [Phellinidium pouzarii]
MAADGNDWINPSFVLQKTGGTPNAQNKIIAYAKSTANEGPWTAFGDAAVLPPSGDKLDYISWAPYHWPDCNWCAGARTHLSTGGNRTNTDGSDDPSADTGSDGEGDDEEGGNSDGDGTDDSDSAELPSLNLPIPIPFAHRKMHRRIRHFAHAHAEERAVLDEPDGDKLEISGKDIPDVGSLLSITTLPTTIVPGADPSSTDGNGNFASGSAEAAENARKTQTAQSKPDTTSVPKGKSTQDASPSKTTAGRSGCTPSPSKSLPPSATWTACPYVVRDGQLNPDVRTLNGVNAIVDVTQSIIYNGLSSVLSGSETAAQYAAKFMQVFFLDSTTGIHPRIEYGQLIRGPGAQTGQFLGLIDFRGMVKLANAVQIFRTAKTPAWTASLDTQMTAWTKQYVKWMQMDPIGQKALSAPKWFQDQIAASGEQPFEAVRTRPFHYRCFNIEAMITNAKLGDQLGLDFWTAQSKYGATIKDALDFVLQKGPGKEDVTDIFPLVAAVAVAYGDPDGKYMAYLRNTDQSFMAAPYYYYNQQGALTKAPSVNAKGKRAKGPDGTDEQQPLKSVDKSLAPTPTDVPLATPTIPWKCPAVFATETAVQLDDGVYVSCDELKHFYGYAVDTATDT